MKPILETIDTRFGTASKHAFSRGNTCHTQACLLGWIILCPRPAIRKELGFRSTSAHLSGDSIDPSTKSWISDYSWLLLTPITGQIGGDGLFHRQSSYDLDKASFQPHYRRFYPYAIRLKPNWHRLAMVPLFVWSKSKGKASPSIFTQQMTWQSSK